MLEYINEHINIVYLFTNMVLIWLIILIIEHSIKLLSSFWKKITTVITSVILAILFVLFFKDDIKILMITACITIVIYDYVTKKLLSVIGKKVISLLEKFNIKSISTE